MLMIASVLSMTLIWQPLQAPAHQDQPATTTSTPATVVLPPVVVSAETRRQDPNREVCRRVRATVGSNRPSRICAPAWQWEQAREDGRNYVLGQAPGTDGPKISTGGEGPPGRGF